ncbi:hypothetical protein LC613_09450 [Nostoc sphaeroides CHAB 2801]|uniref:hypothetical protein n=1 Tax=Nostoc sphaeroides TaxID=446679 RepID=UPI000E46B3D9|nr:hypothetical protein [Nostoc sphaeroides]MCC5628322.1 hypothetical protein [Nostoc sphaeroides CHAB 2801]
MTPSFIEELSGQLKKFKTYLDTAKKQNQDTDVKNLNKHIQETSELLEKTKHKLTEPFNINLPDYTDEYLDELLFYQQKIEEIKAKLSKIKVNDSLNTLLSELSSRISYQIKVRSGKGRPKTRNRDTKF